MHKLQDLKQSLPVASKCHVSLLLMCVLPSLGCALEALPFCRMRLARHVLGSPHLVEPSFYGTCCVGTPGSCTDAAKMHCTAVWLKTSILCRCKRTYMLMWQSSGRNCRCWYVSLPVTHTEEVLILACGCMCYVANIDV